MALWRLRILLLLIAARPCLAQDAAPAQNATPPQDDPANGPIYTLHVYSRHLQVAALVLNPQNENIPGLTKSDVELSLDEGPRFRASMVRPAGDDPISLNILLAANGDQKQLLERVRHTLPRLLGERLHPTDRISLYAVDCTLHRGLDTAVPSPDLIATNLERLLQAPNLHRPNGHTCSSSLHLWDTIGTVLQHMADQPGRRVLLVVSSGLDGDSTLTPGRVSLLAGRISAAIFNIRDENEDDLHTNFQFRVLRGLPTGGDGLRYIANHNGGLVYSILPTETDETFTRLFRTLRTRYIVEFQGPDDDATGFHGIDVFVRKASLVLPAGVSSTIADPALKADPRTVPTSASPAVLGKKRPKPPQ